MNRLVKKALWAGMLVALPLSSQAKSWTLKECIDYALQNNIQLNKLTIQRQSAHEDVLGSKAALLPSLSASTSQSFGYTPWVESGVGSDGYSRVSIDKTYYNGSYSIGAQWTVWDGNKNHNTVKLTNSPKSALPSTLPRRPAPSRNRSYSTMSRSSTSQKP